MVAEIWASVISSFVDQLVSLTLTREVIRDSVQSSAGLLKVHIFRCFQKISLILCNSDIIFRIMFIIKLQTSCGALLTL